MPRITNLSTSQQDRSRHARRRLRCVWRQDSLQTSARSLQSASDSENLIWRHREDDNCFWISKIRIKYLKFELTNVSEFCLNFFNTNWSLNQSIGRIHLGEAPCTGGQQRRIAIQRWWVHWGSRSQQQIHLEAQAAIWIEGKHSHEAIYIYIYYNAYIFMNLKS